MRVNIGPYPNNHWTTTRLSNSWYQWRYKKFDFQVEDEGLIDKWDRAFDKFCDACQWVLNHTVNPLIRNRERRIEVRIDRHDTWSMDVTLGYIILPMLVQLKATKHGSPWVDDEDVPHLVKKKTKKGKKTNPKIHAVDADEEDQHADVHVRWNWVLDEMIWAFEQVVSDDDSSNYYVPYKDGEEVERSCFYNSSTGEKVYLMTEEESRQLGRYDKDLHKAYQDRVNRGLAFFGKYYQNLWD